MGIVLKQFDDAQVTPKDDARLYDYLVGQSGIVEGCEVTHLGANQLQIAAGWGVIKGRVFEITGETVLAQVSDSGTKRGRLYIEVDIANTSTPIAIKTIRATTLPDLEQEEINWDGTVYQLPLAEYDISTTAISNLQTVFTTITGALVSNVITNDIDGDCYATIGTFVKDGVTQKGIFIYDKSVSTTTPRCRITIGAGNVNFFDGNGTLRIMFGLSSGNDMHLYDKNGVSRFSCMNDTTMISVGHNPYGTVFDANSEMVQLSAPNAIQHRLGVDANGPYYVKNMNKVYF